MTPAELENLLAELRAVKTDHQFVETKAARDALPDSSHETLSAFANASGGLFVLGVDEAGGAFNVTGVSDPPQMMQSLQSLCAAMEPPLRPIISVVERDGRSVIVADVPPIAAHLRPCHLQHLGEYAGSFIRVGDADQAWTRAEVDEARANRAAFADHSARPSPASVALDDAAFADFARRARAVPRNADLDDDALKRRYGVVTEAAELTVAGALALGDSPERALAPARVAYRVVGAEGAPKDARFQGEHVEGTIGELLDQLIDRFERDLRTFQVSRAGRVWDELEVPRAALREIISNALMHRSLTPVQEARPVTVEITPDAVVVMSPGSLFSGADIARLGLDGIGGARNPSLVRICDFVRTPTGNRIVENHASGIPTADAACHQAGTMPPLFIDMPATFHAVLLRAAPDLEAAEERLRRRGVEPTESLVRLVGVTARLAEAKDRAIGVPVMSVVMDTRFGARTLAPMSEADAAPYFRQLEEAKVLQRRVVRHMPYWTVHPGLPEPVATTMSDPAETPPRDTEPLAQRPASRSKVKKGDRLFPLLEAVAAAVPEGLTSGEIGRAIGVGSSSRGGWIDKALDNGWITPSSENIFDRTRRFKITAKGRRALQAHQARAAK